MEDTWGAAGQQIQRLARRREVRQCWPRIAGLLQILGEALSQAEHDMEQLSGDGPLRVAYDFQAAFDEMVVTSIAREAVRAAGLDDNPAALTR
jgi:hypothetical protein